MELCSQVTAEDLLKAGFSTQDGKRFWLNEDLYNNIIFVNIKVELCEKEAEIQVIDSNTGKTFFPFYYNPMKTANLVVQKVTEGYQRLLGQLTGAHILREEL